MVGYRPSSFAYLVFTDERIKVGMKRGKLITLLGRMRKTGANKEDENEGETHAVITVPTWKLPTSQTMSLLSQYQSFSLPTTKSSTKAIPKSTTKPVYHTSNHEHHLLQEPKHQRRKEFRSEKAYRIHPNSGVLG